MSFRKLSKLTVKRMNPKKTLKTVLLTFFAIALAAVLYFVSSNLIIALSTRKQIYDLDSFEAKGEGYDCILVLGCGVYSDGTPTPFLSDRLKTAVDLYNMGFTDKILLSGDHINADYDEPGTMRRYCLEKGVPEDAIIIDNLGLSTYESMYRAKNVYGIDSAVIVTQEYHLARAVFDCNSAGIRCKGVWAVNSGYVVAIYNYVRESVARCKDFLIASLKVNPGMGVKNEAEDNILTAVIYGIMWSFMYAAFYLAGIKFFPGNFLRCFPDKVRKETKVRSRIRGVVFKTVVLAALYLALTVFPIMHFELRHEKYLAIVLFTFIVSLTWNLTELVVINGFVRCIVNPKGLWITEEDIGYRDIKFFLRLFVIGVLCSLAAAFICGSISFVILDKAFWL